ncbi:hypothetical protein EYF80_019622 [Liparis tanakae]|uniref:Uncharacterized protein n=1 Tax=Liparis tanakae TaxID=230148 RepID=A0A4Z2HYV0_9TELE|nr:hypothetical protein EYF80_019622 [Liparis tanakae]
MIHQADGGREEEWAESQPGHGIVGIRKLKCAAMLHTILTLIFVPHDCSSPLVPPGAALGKAGPFLRWPEVGASSLSPREVKKDKEDKAEEEEKAVPVRLTDPSVSSLERSDAPHEGEWIYSRGAKHSGARLMLFRGRGIETEG